MSAIIALSCVAALIGLAALAVATARFALASPVIYGGSLTVVNFGATTASLYALGHGRHEAFPLRVLPFFPAFLAGMNLVVLADDAFTFLLSWECMSLTSWALVMAHHRQPGNARA